MRTTSLIFLALLQVLGMSAPTVSAAQTGPDAAIGARQRELMATVPGTGDAKTIIIVALDELHPTQPAVGYDQIYYKLGRYRAEDQAMAATSKPEKFDDYCEANGRGGVRKDTSNIPGATLSGSAKNLQCKHDSPVEYDEMKTVVIGPGGKVYLTDGHHKFTTFWEADGGVNQKLPVSVIVTDNFSSLSDADFWAKMRESKKVWLTDGKNRTITPARLPKHLGLDQLGNDPYRSIVYFARNVAVEIPDDAPEFLEFYWADWIRRQRSLNLASYDLNSAPGYAAAVKTVSTAIVALAPDAVVSGDKSAAALGKKTAVDADALSKLLKPAGKLSYAISYKQWLAKRPKKAPQPAVAALRR
jgi:hypothetical protein